MDVDAVSVYDEALEHATDTDVKEHFTLFRSEHDHHATELARVMARLGGEFERKVDLMGRVADWVTSIRSMRGTEGALHAMHTAEQYHNRKYGEAATWDVGDEELRALLVRFHEDEKHHLEFIETRLQVRARA
jgi:rubrerythrin